MSWSGYIPGSLLGVVEDLVDEDVEMSCGDPLCDLCNPCGDNCSVCNDWSAAAYGEDNAYL